MSSRTNYGIDSPVIVLTLLLLGAICLAAALVFHFIVQSYVYWQLAFIVAGVYFLLGAGGLIYYSKVAKLRIRDQIIGLIPWRGDERVLDVGCGRGLMLIGAARNLTLGKAVGLDLWVRGALTGNRSESVLENARQEGVSERVEVKDGDVRQLPFENNSFDVVVSNFVVHELRTPGEREQMVREIVRVLKPSGRLALVDFIFTSQCVQVLRAAGFGDAKRARVGSAFSFWITAILNFGLVQTYAVTGTKPK